mgnify:CR=1 FL=1
MIIIRKQFTENELNLIINDYKSGMSPKELGEKYSRNPSSVINKLKSIGVYIDSRNNYTKDDEKFLRNTYPVGDWDAIMHRFPNTTKQAIITKAHNMGLSGDYYFWSDDDLLFLKDNYYLLSLDELYLHFNRRYSKDAIQSRALVKFGYSKDDDWNAHEEQLLKQLYPNCTIDKVLEALYPRSLEAIRNHAKKLGIQSYFRMNTVWNDMDTDKLLENWNVMSDYELEQLIGKSKRSIMEKRHSLGLYRVDRDTLRYSDLSKYMRGQISSWKTASMESCNYQCVITGSKDFAIHHLYSFGEIMSLFIEKYNIPQKDFSDYSQSELNHYTDLFLHEHNQFPLGVCIRKDIHAKFHSLYGKLHNTPSQWNDFCQNYTWILKPGQM